MRKSKNRIIQNIVIAIVLFVFFGIVFHSVIINALGVIDNAIYERIRIINFSDFNVKSQEECNRNGGKWEMMGGFQKVYACQYYSKDGGKTCFAGYQCELGICEPYNNKSFTFGTCRSILKQFKCESYIHFGVVVPGPCAD